MSASLDSRRQSPTSGAGRSATCGQTPPVSAERNVRADVFVFAVHTEREPDAYNALDLSKWEFYVVGSDAVNAQTRTVGIAWVRTQAPYPVPFEGPAQAIPHVASASADAPR